MIAAFSRHFSTKVNLKLVGWFIRKQWHHDRVDRLYGVIVLRVAHMYDPRYRSSPVQIRFNCHVFTAAHPFPDVLHVDLPRALTRLLTTDTSNPRTSNDHDWARTQLACPLAYLTNQSPAKLVPTPDLGGTYPTCMPLATSLVIDPPNR